MSDETHCDFTIWADDLHVFEKAGDDNPMRIGGIVSTSKLDKQNERVLQQGLDFAPFLESGWYNDNHGQRTADILGYPTGAKFVTKGETLSDGSKAGKNGWWTEGYLAPTEEGRRIWNLARALAKSPRKLGFSIEGKVIERAKDRKTITRAEVKNVAITHVPVNTDTELNVLAKALTAGHAVAAADVSSGTAGDGGVLRTESLEGGLSHQEWDDDDDTDEVIGKAEDFTLEPIDEDALFDEWAPSLSKAAAKAVRSVTLTKAEAEIIVRDRYPHLDDAAVDRILGQAAGGST